MPAPEASTTRGASTPRRPLPAGAWDTHAHVFGPFDRYPLAADCRYQPPLATAASHIAALDAAGFAHGVLVHASANGFDNSAVLDAVAAHPSRLAVIAVFPESVSDEELAAARAAGVRGIRFTETGDRAGAAKPSGTLGLDALERMAPRLQAFGLHAQLWAKCQFVVDARAMLERCGIPLVFDHMGYFDVGLGVDDRCFRSFLDLAGNTASWVKLTPTRVTKQRWNDCSDVRPFHDALLQAAPERMLWGSDWPYIAMDKDLPDMGTQIDLLDAWTADDALRQHIFVDNPRRLYDAGR
ncbi:MAG TPA: amidohydrolase family protein [Ramlibacter sp.]|nr:amidohydrolase family protein [Ramlibacter sp.]